MFRNYLKIALRQLRKQKMYAAITIGGFALGIAACLLIALYIRNEVSYDRSWPEASRMYRLVGQFNDNGTISKGTSVQPPMAQAIKMDFPEVEKAGRLMGSNLFWGAGSNYVTIGGRTEQIFESGFAYADQELIDIFQPQMVYGNRKDALAEPLTMLISRRKAEKFFPGENPIGKVVYLNMRKDRRYQIGGVMENFPVNSHLQYDFLLTLTGKELWQGEQAGWGSSNYDTYFLIKEGTDIAQLEKKATTVILEKYVLPNLRASGYKDADKIGKNASIHLQRVPDIHLNSYDINDRTNAADIRFIWLFGAIGGFILLIACINFINLTTARSANRAREVGLRKVVGSLRASLVKQFLTESVLFSVIAFMLGLLLASALVPLFNKLAVRSLTIPWQAWWLFPIIAGAAIITGIFAGLYPAFYLSAFKPIKVLKGQVSRGSKNSLLRNGLVVFQFATSVILIISTIVIYRQMQFILNRKAGFDKDQVILIEGTHTLGSGRVQQFKNELLKLSAVKSVSISDYLPVEGTKRNGNDVWNEGKTTIESAISSQVWQIDHDYLPTMGIHLAAGRNFSPGLPTDSQGVIINQTLAKSLNLTDPVGKRITNGDWTSTILGVVEDFNYASIRQPVNGLVLQLSSSPSLVSVKVNPGDMHAQIDAITAVWKKFAPSQPIQYNFLDERFASMYADVQRTGYIFTCFSVLAIIIASLGLFALAAFLSEQRSKEISIRKVLGASVGQVTTLLSREFVKLVLISVVIASPIAWWAMDSWLQNFAYRTTVSWWVFLLAGIAALAIALITVSFQAIKAAIANPVETLRSE